MKKSLILLFLLGVLSIVNAQNIVQITNNGNSSNTQKDCDYKINGICSSEDIGGVSLEEIRRVLRGGAWEFCQNYDVYADLKNYNNFTVTVLLKFEYHSNSTDDEETYQVVIPSNGTKTITLKRCLSSPYSLQGMIVRRLQN